MCKIRYFEYHASVCLARPKGLVIVLDLSRGRTITSPEQ